MRASQHDVAIVGGGPGGLHAAARLAAAGHDVAVLEEHSECGQPVHCTGILAESVFDEIGLPRDAVLNTLPPARFVSPSGLDLPYSPTIQEAVVIDRAAFDRMLARRAADAGATMLQGARVTGLTVEADGVRLERQGHEPVSARTVILACGASYVFQRQLGLGMPSVYLNSAQLELPAAREGAVELYFGAETAPRGFAWAVPVQRPSGPHVRIGVMCDGDAGEYFRRMVKRVGRSWGTADGVLHVPRRRLLPLGSIRRTYADRVLAIGDAAGLVKPTTGGGIYYSLVSAEIAAETLDVALRGDNLAAPALSRYETCWRKRFMPEFRTQLALRMLAQRLSDRELDDLFDLARTDGIMPLVRRTARFNRHRDLIVALFRHQAARRVLFRRLAA